MPTVNRRTAAATPKTVKVKDDVGLAPIKDSAVQHHYVAMTQDMLDEVTGSRTYERFFGVESRDNKKEAPLNGGWTNVILPGKESYVELLPLEVAGDFPMQFGVAMAVQSADSAAKAQANLAKLFDGNTSADVMLDVKDNRKSGDLTVEVKPTTREIPQWSPGKDKETGKAAFAGDWIGAWGTDEEKPSDHSVLTLEETLKPHYKPHRLAEHVVELNVAAGADDMANLGKMFAAHGFSVELKGVADGSPAPAVSTLNAYLQQQAAAHAQPTLIARAPTPDTPVVRVTLDEDKAHQGFVSERISLKHPSPETFTETAVAASGARFTLSARKGAQSMTLTGQKPEPKGP